jgi:hypothetical protein
MIRIIGLAVVFSSIALPSLAAQHCDQPVAPKFHVAAGATEEQIATQRRDVQTFIAASDVYQSCLSKVAQWASIRLIEANQAEKERIGSRFNSILGSYKEAVAQTSGSGKLASR